MSTPVSKLKKRWMKEPGFKEGYDAVAAEFAPASKFDAFMREIEDEAKAEGPQAVKELDALRAHFRASRRAR
jgi:hypothetical protein